MLSCLGIYIDKNLIKYAKVKRVKDSYTVEAYNVETFENLREAIVKVIKETNSERVPVSVSISNELYNYFDVFSALEKKDITKSLDIEFEMVCNEKKYDKESIESRYILMDNMEDPDKYKSLYVSVNKKELDELINILSNYKLHSISTVSTSITNLIPDDEGNIAIVNIENETKITKVIDGQITRVDVLNSGLEEIVGKINKIEMSWKKAYDVFKNITIYNNEAQSIDENENEYLDIVMPVLYKIASEVQKKVNSYKEKISKVYITGLGATINNIDLYMQEFLNKTRCEILKPFFIDPTSIRVPVKEYIEVNSAIALALDGLGFLNTDLNFAPYSRFENNIDSLANSTEDFDIKNWKDGFNEAYSIYEKVLLRAIIIMILIIFGFSITSKILSEKINKQMALATDKYQETSSQIEDINTKISKIQSYVDTYSSIVSSVDSLSDVTITNRNNRVVPKDAIPNLLNELMFVIPQQVQITSIKNTENKHIVIEAVSEKYEQLGYFSSAIEVGEILKNVQTSSGSKTDSLVQITIEGDLP